MESDDSSDHINFSIASGCFLDQVCQLCGNFKAVHLWQGQYAVKWQPMLFISSCLAYGVIIWESLPLNTFNYIVVFEIYAPTIWKVLMFG